MTHGRSRILAMADTTLLAMPVLLMLACGILAIRYGWDAKYGLLAFIGLLSFSLLWMRPAARISAALFIVSSIVALSVANVVLGLRAHMDQQFPRSHWLHMQTGAEHVPVLARTAQKLGVPFDRRSRLEVMQDLLLEGTEAWPTISPPLLFNGWPSRYRDPVLEIGNAPLLPLGGISNAKTVYCNESGTYVVYESGRHGFANPPHVWSRGAIDVALVGDSFVHGACVPYDQSFPSLIRNKFPGTLNLGRDGVGPLAELAIIKEYLPHIRPKTVVWAYFEYNDFSELRKEKDSFLARYLEPSFSQDLIHRQSEIDEALKGYVHAVLNGGSVETTMHVLAAGVGDLLTTTTEWERLVKFSFIWESMAQLAAKALHPSLAVAESDRWIPRPAASDQEVEIFQRALEQTRALAQSWGGQVVFVYLPQYERYARPDFTDPHRDRILAMVESLHIPVIDIHEVFQSQKDVLGLFPFRQSAHFTPEGYRLVAEAIIRHLERQRDAA